MHATMTRQANLRTNRSADLNMLKIGGGGGRDDDRAVGGYLHTVILYDFTHCKTNAVKLQKTSIFLMLHMVTNSCYNRLRTHLRHHGQLSFSQTPRSIIGASPPERWILLSHHAAVHRSLREQGHDPRTSQHAVSGGHHCGCSSGQPRILNEFVQLLLSNLPLKIHPVR